MVLCVVVVVAVAAVAFSSLSTNGRSTRSQLPRLLPRLLCCCLVFPFLFRGNASQVRCLWPSSRLPLFCAVAAILPLILSFVIAIHNLARNVYCETGIDLFVALPTCHFAFKFLYVGLRRRLAIRSGEFLTHFLNLSDCVAF
jgi:hypothetical protein